jgi:hypothetical protein
MVAHRQVESSSQVDSSAEKLAVRFAIGSKSGKMSWNANDAWYCETLVIKVGPRPSHARVVIPAQSNDEAANVIAFDPTGPAKNIKIGTQCAISKQWTSAAGATMAAVLFVGKVQLIEYDRDNDQLIIDVVDARADLRELYIVGRWVHVPADDEGHPAATTYQQGWPAHFNPGGRPNCLYDGSTQKPEFAPYPDYGLSGNEQPDMSAPDFSKASYWTLGRILEYLRYHYGPDAAGVTQWPLLPKAPEWLVWPADLGQTIDQEDVANFDSGLGQGTQNTGGARKGREVVLEGYGLLESLDLLLSIAGGYSLAVTARSKEDSGGSAKFINILSVAKTRYVGGGISLPYAASGAPTGAGEITGGTFIEDGEDFVSSIFGRSQLCFVERRFSTHDDDNNTLKPAWSTARETEFRTAIISLGNDIAAYREACSLYPEVYTTWVVDSQYDFLADTPWSGYPRAALARTPWPTQLSYMTDAIGTRDYAGMRWPIYVEINTGSTWVRGPLFDGLEILDTGVISIPALRDLGAEIKVFAGTAGATSVIPFADDGSGAAQIEVRDIRMNLALPCDHGISWAALSPAAGELLVGDASLVEVYAGNPDVARIDPDYVRRKYVDLQQLYASIYRIGSYYKPESCGGEASAAEYIRDDLTLLQAHVRRLMYEENRLRKGGALRFDGHIVPYALGQAILDLTASGKKPFPIRAQLTGIKFSSTGGDRPATSTELLFGD